LRSDVVLNIKDLGVRQLHGTSHPSLFGICWKFRSSSLRDSIKRKSVWKVIFSLARICIAKRIILLALSPLIRDRLTGFKYDTLTYNSIHLKAIPSKGGEILQMRLSSDGYVATSMHIKEEVLDHCATS